MTSERSWIDNMMDSESAQDLLLDLFEKSIHRAKNLAVTGVEYPYVSPIEFAMATAMCAVSNVLYPEIAFCATPNLTREEAEVGLRHMRLDPSVTRPPLGCVFRQVKIEPYRVDFLVLWGRGLLGSAGIAVECDGHEWHEKTKEQAANDKARDRSLQERGFKVFHYTGSEIWRDPIKCAREVMGIAHADAIDIENAPLIRSEGDYAAVVKALS